LPLSLVRQHGTRNGAGTTTLPRILAGQEFPSSGGVLVHGAPPAENEAVLRRKVFVREDQTYPDVQVRHALRVASWFYPQWSAELADALLADFGLPAGRPVKKLSRGMRSALGIVIGLAARVVGALDQADRLRGLGAALSARTMTELAALIANLPGAGGARRRPGRSIRPLTPARPLPSRRRPAGGRSSKR
jgi:ABC-type transport system involved in cytochrome c biogenesis ATPase subunit